MLNIKEQGVNAETVFHGEALSEAGRLIYKESAPIFAQAIRSNLKAGEYVLADLGSSKGEFLEDFLSLLPEYTFNTIAVDVNVRDLEVNIAHEKVLSNISQLALANKSIDVTLARYALAWNDLETQKEILKEIKRTTKHLAIIQHQGANSVHAEGLQARSRQLFGGIVPQLQRDKFFFSTPEQLEHFMKELDISFERIQERDVPGLSNLFIEKYNLSEVDAHNTQAILSGADYVTQAAWILKF